MRNKKVFVSGCFDMFHSGHVAFLEEASKYGELYVGIGSDKTIYDLKKTHTINSENERLYMVKSSKFVKDAFINSGFGFIDFKEEIKKLKPDIFFVNSDGDSLEKELFCKGNGIEYIVSKRIPKGDLPKRSTTDIRQKFKSISLDEILEMYSDEDFMIADGFDDAIMGVEQNSMRLIYSASKTIKILSYDMSENEAEEYFYYNVLGAYVGEKTPIWCFDYL